MTTCCVYLPASGLGLPQNPFGKDVANLALYRALARYLPQPELTFLVHNFIGDDALSSALYGAAAPTKRIRAVSALNDQLMRAAGTVVRGQPHLQEMAWFRRNVDDRAYSLVGLVHTLAPMAIRDSMANAVIAPLQPWDAFICTSPAVRDNLSTMLDGMIDHLAGRFGGTKRPRPALPVIPLGIDMEEFDRGLAAPDLRDELRAAHGIGAGDLALLWLGRLSYFEKAYPHAMFAAAERAARSTGRRLHLLMVGWFPDATAERPLYEEAARAAAPSVPVHFLDGGDRTVVSRIWAAADVFLSLVDNVQETFGLSPIEAMAARLPVVASDWDGYRFTIRHGVDGFRVPTLMAPAGTGIALAARHMLGIDSYQAYAGSVARHTAVDVGAAAQAIATLAADPALRRRMGEAGRKRVAENFSWHHVIGQYVALFKELADRRSRAQAFDDPATARLIRQHPAKSDPFACFAGFATDQLNRDTILSLAVGWNRAALDAVRALGIFRPFAIWNAAPAVEDALIGRLATGGPQKLSDLVAGLPPDQAPAAARSIMWLAKIGAVTWPARQPVELDRRLPEPPMPPLSWATRTIEQVRGVLTEPTQDDTARLQRALRLAAMYRAQLIANTLVSTGGAVVRGGPFAGLKLPRAMAEGCMTPKLLGCYEAELHGVVARIVKRAYADVVNIGCADGYYAIGLARLMPQSRIWAFDSDKTARKVCANTAADNGVAERVIIGGTLTAQDFARFAAGRTVVLCDIEGGELELLDPAQAPALTQFDLLVELHNNADILIYRAFLDRFRASHEIEHFAPGSRDIAAYPELARFDHLDQLLAFWEYRRGPTPWVFMTSRARR